MGWASGSHLLSEIIQLVREEVPSDRSRRTIYTRLVDLFEAEDCDTIDECAGIDSIFDEILAERFDIEDDDDPEEEDIELDYGD